MASKDLPFLRQTGRALFLWLLLFSAGLVGLRAQLIPPILNYQPTQYKAENQNWDIAQGQNGWMYFANNSGLLEFNGESWNAYPSPNGSVLRSVEVHQDRVYTGCYMEFGYWAHDATGAMVYQSLSTQLQAPLLEDEQFWNIRVVDNWVLFQSLQRIYAYHVEDSRLEILPSQASRAQLFVSSGQVYFLNQGKLMRLENGEVHEVVSLDSGTGPVVGLVGLEGQPALVTEQGSFFKLTGGRLVPGTLQIPAANTDIQVYSSLQLRDGRVALGTVSQGLIILDPSGGPELHLNKENGLNNNTVLTLEEDRNGDLWLGLDHGISVLNRSSFFREYNDATGRMGEVYTAAHYQGFLYIGTNQGLFRSSYPEMEAFEFIAGTEGQVWDLSVIDNTLFCGHHRGTFTVRQDGIYWISRNSGTWDFKPVPGADSLVLQGHYQGLSVLVKEKGTWRLRNTLEGHDLSSRFFDFTPEGKLVVNHEYKGVYVLEPDPGLRQLKPLAQYEPLGKGASLFRYRDQLYYATDTAVYAYKADLSFGIDSVLTREIKGRADRPFGVMVADAPSGRLWGFGHGTIHYVEAGTIDKSLRFNRIHVPDDFRLSMGVLGFECIAPLERDRYLIGRSNGFVVLQLDQVQALEPVAALTGVWSYQAGGTHRRESLGSAEPLEAERNNVAFSFSVPQYNKFSEVEYQYRLSGLQPHWSSWSSEPRATFTNLRHGDYRFELRARIGDAVTKVPVAYSFEIRPPWYLSGIALGIYFLLGLALAFGIHSVYRGYYRNQHKKMLERDRLEAKRDALKAKKKLMEARNAQLSQEIESKNRELAVSTMSLIRKNEFLNTLKSQLKSAGSASEIRSVIRAIDRNIGSEDDWKFFEEAFNNADKEFLKTIKDLHPDLTPNDLRLCAYLRLNLSSKEIAPLLNISVRSVEVKRYRLRKKMGLPREQSLTEYVLGL